MSVSKNPWVQKIILSLILAIVVVILASLMKKISNLDPNPPEPVIDSSIPDDFDAYVDAAPKDASPPNDLSKDVGRPKSKPKPKPPKPEPPKPKPPKPEPPKPEPPKPEPPKPEPPKPEPPKPELPKPELPKPELPKPGSHEAVTSVTKGHKTSDTVLSDTEKNINLKKKRFCEHFTPLDQDSKIKFILSIKDKKTRNLPCTKHENTAINNMDIDIDIDNDNDDNLVKKYSDKCKIIMKKESKQ